MPPVPAVVDTIRNKLQAHGLPGALLPATATAFHLDEATGKFTVSLDQETVVEPGGYKVTYSKQIRGTLSKGAIRDLEGVTVKIAFTKPAITSIALEPDGEQLTFSVAGMKRSVPKSAFEA
jgi:hypothetical protein